MDKAGNGYVCAVDPAFFAVMIGILGPEHKFVKVPGVEKIKIDHIIQHEKGDTEESGCSFWATAWAHLW